MPASNINVYSMQDARNNFGAVRPVPICADANEFIGQCRNRIHVSTNIYYGYHTQKAPETKNDHDNTDFEMETCNDDVEISIQKIAKKRGAEDIQQLQIKRLKEEVQKEKTIEPETSEKKILSNTEDLLETLFWHTHGGSMIVPYGALLAHGQAQATQLLPLK